MGDEGEAPPEGAGEQEQLELPPDGLVLSKEMMASSLSMLSKVRGVSEYAYVKADLRDKDLRSLGDIGEFPHVQKLIVGENKLDSLAEAAVLKHLLLLEADKNRLTNLDLVDMEYLQILNASENQLEEVNMNGFKSLRRLQLKKNAITSVTGIQNCPNLAVLELRENKLTDFNSLASPIMEELWLAQNEISDLAGLENFPSLRILHLRGNKITGLDKLPKLGDNNKFENGVAPALERLNLRGNQIEDVKHMFLLRNYPTLRNLNVLENPVADTDNFRIETIIILPWLKVLNKQRITLEERNEAKALLAERKAAEEEARREAEEAARLAAEEAAAAEGGGDE